MANTNNNLQYKLDLQRIAFSRQMAGAIRQVEILDSKIDALNKKKIGGGNGGEGFLKKAAIGSAFAYMTGKVVDFEKAVVESLVQAEYFSASLKTLLQGNGNEAAALENQLIQLAKTTPFSLREVQDSTKQLLAYGFAAGNITKNIQMLGDVSAGVGQPISEIVYLYGTLRTQGRAFAKDIYQFTGRGIPIVRELAKQFKTTDDKVADLVRDGKIGFAEIEKAFKSMTAEGGQFFNMMDAQSKTVGGRLSNLGDSWDQLKVNIGKSQSGIIANTVSWASKMVEVLNTYFVDKNYRDSATDPIGGYDDQQKDNRYSTMIRKAPTYKSKSFWAMAGSSLMPGLSDNTKYNDQQGPSFATVAERQQFLKNNPQYSQGTLIRGTDALDQLSKQLRRDTETVKPEDAQNKINELTELSRKYRQDADSGMTSRSFEANALALISKTIGQLKGLIDLEKSKSEDANSKNSISEETGIGKGLEEGFARPQNLYITINKLTGIEHLELNSSVSESVPRIREIIAETMLEAVNDANNMMK